MRLCTKHCSLLALIATGIVLALRFAPAPLHVPFGQTAGCAVSFSGWPFGYLPEERTCLSTLQFSLQYFFNGLLDALVFFLPLSYLHSLVLHRR